MKDLKLKRLFALFLDFSIITIVLSSIIKFIFDNIFSEESIVYVISFIITYTITYFILLIRKDLLFRNASLGKKIVGIAIFNENNEVPSKIIIIKRVLNGIYMFPLIPFMILGSNKTFGDIKYNTVVDYTKKID